MINKNKEKPTKGYLQKKSAKKSVKSKVRSLTRGKKNAKIIKGGNPGQKLASRPSNSGMKSQGENSDIKAIQKEYKKAKFDTQALMYNFTHFIQIKTIADLPKKEQKRVVQKYIRFYDDAYNAIIQEFLIKEKMRIAYNKQNLKLYPDIKDNQMHLILIKMKKSGEEFKKLSEKALYLINKSNTESNYTKGYFQDLSNVLSKVLNITYELQKYISISDYYRNQ